MLLRGILSNAYLANDHQCELSYFQTLPGLLGFELLTHGLWTNTISILDHKRSYSH